MDASAKLKDLGERLLQASYHPATLLSYHKSWGKLMVFMRQYNLSSALPISAKILWLITVHMHYTGMKESTIRVALSGIAYVHKINSLTDHSKSFLILRTLKGIKKSEGNRPKLLPINLVMLHKLLDKISLANFATYKTVLIKSILLLSYYGCMRIGELVHSSHDQHTLLIENLSIICNENNTYSLLEKMDSFKHAKASVSFIIPSSHYPNYCPVTIILKFLKIRSVKNGPFFIYRNDVPVKRTFVADILKKYIALLGYDPTRYNTHSLRIGRATDLALSGYSEQIIRQTVRWESDAYLKYIRFNFFKVPSNLNVR